MKHFIFTLLAFIFVLGIATSHAAGISDEITINGESSWQVQAFEGLSETYKATKTYERVTCGDDLKVENACEFKITEIGFVGIAGNTAAEGNLCRTGKGVGGEGAFESKMYLDVVVPLPFCHSYVQVGGASSSYVNVWAK